MENREILYYFALLSIMTSYKTTCKIMNNSENKQDQEPIVLNWGMTVKLQRKFGCYHGVVKKALEYKGNTPLHQAIRKEAKKMVDEFMKQYDD